MCAFCVTGVTLETPSRVGGLDRPGALRGRAERSPLPLRGDGPTQARHPARRARPGRLAHAQSVRAGLVRVGRGGERPTKPGQLVPEDTELRIDDPPRYVSRGGVKLENALRELRLDVDGLDCMDVGASTGGFTDCLLRRGAARVIAVDVGHGQLDWRLRNDPRVHVVERANARALRSDTLPWRPRLVTVDVSFISLATVLPALVACLADEGAMLAMVKPQFELGPERVGRGGVVRDAADRRDALLGVAALAPGLDLVVRGFASSGLPGPKGNRESFVWMARAGDGIDDLDAAVRRVDP
jgi:23S rRNA (cytidine1920-2'-O)/16S rRNA (cytidine1409-2'-O)-methyltransferase